MDPVPSDRSLDTGVRRKGARLALLAAIGTAVLLLVWIVIHLVTT